MNFFNVHLNESKEAPSPKKMLQRNVKGWTMIGLLWFRDNTSIIVIVSHKVKYSVSTETTFYTYSIQIYEKYWTPLLEFIALLVISRGTMFLIFTVGYFFLYIDLYDQYTHMHCILCTSRWVIQKYIILNYSMHFAIHIYLICCVAYFFKVNKIIWTMTYFSQTAQYQ